MRTVAVIDLGTNTFHLLMARLSDDSFTIIHRERVAVRIGKNGISKGFIADDAIERAVSTLTDFREKVEQEAITDIRVVGTSAIRNAANREQFISTIFDKTGFKIEVIDGKYESELIFKGVQLALDIEETSLVMDIGGGSVEFIIATPDGLLWNHSFEIGAQRLLDQFHYHDPILASEVENLFRFFGESLPLLAEAVEKYQPRLLVGSSGTFDTLSEIYAAHEGLEISRDQRKLPLTIKGFETIHDELIHKDREERLAIPGMIEMRVDMIVVASCLVKYILDTFGFRKIKVSTFALKEGVLNEMIHTSIATR